MTGLALSIIALIASLLAIAFVRRRLADKPKPPDDLPPIVLPSGVEVFAYEQGAIYPTVARDAGLAYVGIAMPVFRDSDLIVSHRFGRQHAAERFAEALRHRGYTVFQVVSEPLRHECEGLVA